jgi:hypothetical protein
MIALPRPEYDAIEIADNARRALAKRSATAANNATKALWSHLDDVIGVDHAKALIALLTEYPDRCLGECLNALGYVVTEVPPDPAAPKCYIVVRNDEDCDCKTPIHAFAIETAAREFCSDLSTHVVTVDFEPASEPEVPEDLDLDMLAADISKMLSRYGYDEWGLENVSDDEIRPALAAFVAACLANAANVIPVPLCGHCDKPCILAAHVDGHDNPADCRCDRHAIPSHRRTES